MIIKEKFTKMMDLKTNFATLGDEKITINKHVARINQRIRERTKSSTCYLCGRGCTSFCNSHSVPQISLRVIAEKGKVAQVLQGEFPLMGDDTGVKSAGTFQIICRECDGVVFQEYENPCAYTEKPTEKMLAQIALKNELHMISKRLQEKELYDYLEKRYDNIVSLGSGKCIEELDLEEYIASLRYAKKTLSQNLEGRYHLCYHRNLDYVVPVATQAMLCLVADFEDVVINNIYNLSDNYNIALLHVAVFPLENNSVVLAFVESKTKRYRKFIKQLKKLEAEDQLAAINYMIFSYSENVFLHPSTYTKLKENTSFMEVCRRTTVAQTPSVFGDSLKVAVNEFSFSKRNSIPNLLGKEFAIKVQ